MYPSSKWLKLSVFCSAVLLLTAPARVFGQAALLLEEPYSYDGTFAGTGHVAVYLARVCAESPTTLRRCRPGERGVVISRYHGIAGYDWIAVPLIPYLYAVQKPEDVPLFVDAKLVALLRERYLAGSPFPAEGHQGAEPRYELAGSAYDRTLYGFRIATRPEQDDALIRLLNSSPNKAAYTLLKSNCADFVKDIINFYYPHAVHRSIIADLGVTTPKQTARSLVHFGKHHRQMQLTTFVIPQVPGLKRSKPLRGVLESLILAKKYVTPVLVFHPVVVGSVEAAYWTWWRFNPGSGALILDPSAPDVIKGLDAPLSASRRQFYEGLISLTRKEDELEQFPTWQRIQALAAPQLDAQGRPFLEVRMDGRLVPVGICRGNALSIAGSTELLQGLLLSRLGDELKAKRSRVSEQALRSDWQLLESARATGAALANNSLGSY
jgi:hypothetical protein